MTTTAAAASQNTAGARRQARLAPASTPDSGYWATFLSNIQDIQSFFEEDPDGLPSLSPSPSPSPSPPPPHGQPQPQAYMGTAPGSYRAATAVLDANLLPRFGQLPDPGLYTTARILTVLPPRSETDRLLALYFGADFCRPTFLHAHQFRRRYEAFWRDPPGPTGPLWASILFSVLATAAMIAECRGQRRWRPDEKKGEVGDSDLGTAESLSAHAAGCLVAGRYLDAGPMAVEALIVYAYVRQFIVQDSKAAVWWLFTLVARIAQRRGYHREPAAARETPFEAEMRRRVWFYVLSTDLLFSFQAGIPTVIEAGGSYGTAPPTNLDDDDFDEDSAWLPAPRPATMPGAPLMMVYKHELMQIMRRAIAVVLAVEQPQPVWRVWEVHDELMAWSDRVAQCMRLRPIGETSFADSNSLIMHRVILAVQFDKCLCVLHRQYLRGRGDEPPLPSRSGEPRPTSREVCTAAALRILDVHADVDAATRPGGRMWPDRHMLGSLTLGEFLIAAMVICLVLNDDQSTAEAGAGAGVGSAARATKLEALGRAHSIWRERSRETGSRDAVDAARVLGAMLRKVSAAGPTPPQPAGALTSSAWLSSPQGPVQHTPAESVTPLGAESLEAEPGAASAAEPWFPAVDFSNSIDWVAIDEYLRLDPSMDGAASAEPPSALG